LREEIKEIKRMFNLMGECENQVVTVLNSYNNECNNTTDIEIQNYGVKRDLSNNENVARKNEDNVKITMELMS
jgi:hypothetical protein